MLGVLSTETVLLRLLLAMVAGLVLGLDREFKKKPGDFRVYSIVSVASALLALLSLQLFRDFAVGEAHVRFDPGRIIQGILMGIGFLGAGVILHRDRHVIGTATGATIWACGALGLTIGYGYFTLALAAFAMMFFILTVLGFFMPYISKRRKAD